MYHRVLGGTYQDLTAAPLDMSSPRTALLQLDIRLYLLKISIKGDSLLTHCFGGPTDNEVLPTLIFAIVSARDNISATTVCFK